MEKKDVILKAPSTFATEPAIHSDFTKKMIILTASAMIAAATAIFILDVRLYTSHAAKRTTKIQITKDATAVDGNALVITPVI